MEGRRLLTARFLCSVTAVRSSMVQVPPAPCAPVQVELLRAVLSKLPSGALVSADQLRSLMGVHARDLCGVPLKQVGGSWEIALKNVLGDPQRKRGQSRRNQGDRDRYMVPAASEIQWMDPRPPPPLSTSCLGELVDGSTTWLTNDPSACDELVAQCGFEQATHIGLDTEWTPTMVRGQQPAIAMLQLATREHCVLVRVGQMPRSRT